MNKILDVEFQDISITEMYEIKEKIKEIFRKFKFVMGERIDYSSLTLNEFKELSDYEFTQEEFDELNLCDFIKEIKKVSHDFDFDTPVYEIKMTDDTVWEVRVWE